MRAKREGKERENNQSKEYPHLMSDKQLTKWCRRLAVEWEGKDRETVDNSWPFIVCLLYIRTNDELLCWYVHARPCGWISPNCTDALEAYQLGVRGSQIYQKFRARPHLLPFFCSHISLSSSLSLPLFPALRMQCKRYVMRQGDALWWKGLIFSKVHGGSKKKRKGYLTKNLDWSLTESPD